LFTTNACSFPVCHFSLLESGKHSLAWGSGDEQFTKLKGETHLEMKYAFMFLLFITLNPFL
jgi:hypothetical protein